MKVTIKLFAPFNGGRFEKEEWDLVEGTPVSQVLNLLKIEPADTMIVINEKLGSEDEILHSGDVLSVLAPLAGG